MASAAMATISGNFDYIAGVEVSDFSGLPREIRARSEFPNRDMPVFTHRDHISTIRRTVNTIWNHWLPASGPEGGRRAQFRNAMTRSSIRSPATGGLEIWIPVGQ